MGAALQGADRLAGTLQRAADQVADLSDVDHDTGRLLAEAGAKAAPRLTGRLAGAHGYTVVDVGDGSAVVVTAATPYARVVHARNPWLTRTVEAKTDQVLDLYLAGLEAGLDTVKGT